MNAAPPPQLLSWAETLGELIGRSLVKQLRASPALGALLAPPPPRSAATSARALSAAGTIAPRRRGRPPGSKNKPRDPSPAGAQQTRRPRVKESVEGFEAGSDVSFYDGQRYGKGSILTVDDDDGILSVLDLDSRAVLKLLPSQVRIARKPQIRRRGETATGASAEGVTLPEPAPADAAEEVAASTDASGSGRSAPRASGDRMANAWSQVVSAVAAAAAASEEPVPETVSSSGAGATSEPAPAAGEAAAAPEVTGER